MFQAYIIGFDASKTGRDLFSASHYCMQSLIKGIIPALLGTDNVTGRGEEGAITSAISDCGCLNCVIISVL